MKYSNLYLSYDFGLQINSINLGLSPKHYISSEVGTHSYNIELTVNGSIDIIDKNFDVNKITTAFGDYLIVITGGLIYQLKDWVVKDITMNSDQLMSIVLNAESIDKDGKIQVTFTDRKHDVNPSDYLNVYNIYGLPDQFTYDEFIVRAVAMEI